MLLHHILTSQADHRPSSVAIVSHGQSVTYGQLDDISSRLAGLLKEAGCVKGDRVGILLPKSVPAIAAFIASMKAGCIYVPLDPSSPALRLARIIHACQPRCILASPPTGDRLNALFAAGVKPDSLRLGWLDPEPHSQHRFNAAFDWRDLISAPPVMAVDGNEDESAHILFTSGSTGEPKGVIITHSNVWHFVEWAVRYFGTTAADRISCHPPLHFDLSTFDIYGTFRAGAELHLVPPQLNLLPLKLAEFIRRSELTQWFSVPSVLRYMAQFDALQLNDFPALRRVLWCGEALPTPTLIHWMRRLPHARFTNLYGPTETTIASSYYTVPSCPGDDKAEIPIGIPCDGESMMVLDESLQPVAPGKIGDLYIGGVGLSPGYWRDPRKTASAFITEPLRGRIYRTGDLARVGPDGLVFLLGRADSQIKSRGYRIELGEIEAALHALGSLQECAVVAVPSDGFEGTEICCAYVPQPGANPSAADLHAQVSAVLPSYMMPSRWMPLAAMPLNANGKIDRPQLKERFQTVAMTA